MIPKEMVEVVCHSEQLEIWADEFVEHLLAAECAPQFDSYDEKITYFSAVKDGIKDLVEKAFDHPALTAALSSPLPGEIGGLIEDVRHKAKLDRTQIAAALERTSRENERLEQELNEMNAACDAQMRRANRAEAALSSQWRGMEPRGCPTPGACSCPPPPAQE